MKETDQEQKQAERLLQSNGIRLHDIERFSFMKRYYPKPHKGNQIPKEKYGAGILTLHLKEDRGKAIYLRPCKHPSAVIHYLLARGIPFDNYKPREREAGITIPQKKYCRASLYMLYFVSLFLVFAIMGVNAIASGLLWGILLGILSISISLFMLYALLTRFGYLTLDNESITIHSLGRTVRYLYSDLRKVNFDYAREKNFTYNMEVLDKNFDYHLYYIGRVPRTKMKEITKYLKEAGIDATCKVDNDSRYYNDYYHKH